MLVLLVEDEHGSAEVMRLVLEAHHYRVATASNGRAAKELLAGERPAVIVSDYMMPHVDGAELGRYVRADPLLADIPFVFVTATSEDVVRRHFDDYDLLVPKPAEVARLLEFIERFGVEGRQARPRSADIDQSMKQLLRGIEIPPRD